MEYKSFLFEKWLPVVGWEKYYEVSNYGRVRSLDRVVYQGERVGYTVKKGRCLKTYKKNGYLFLILTAEGKKKNVYVHRLVSEAFIPNPDNLPCINHKDENKLNNYVALFHDGSYDAEHSNLEWCDIYYNNTYGSKQERAHQTKVKNGICKKVELVNNDRVIKCFDSVKDAVNEGIDTESTIYYCLSGRNKRGKTNRGNIWRYC